jgi:hypothetical protein
VLSWTPLMRPLPGSGSRGLGLGVGGGLERRSRGEGARARGGCRQRELVRAGALVHDGQVDDVHAALARSQRVEQLVQLPEQARVNLQQGAVPVRLLLLPRAACRWWDVAGAPLPMMEVTVAGTGHAPRVMHNVQKV